MRLISQLVNGSSRVLQKLLIYFSGTSISTFFVPSSPVKPIIFLFKFKRSAITRKISNIASSSQSWFVSIVLP